MLKIQLRKSYRTQVQQRPVASARPPVCVWTGPYHLQRKIRWRSEELPAHPSHTLTSLQVLFHPGGVIRLNDLPEITFKLREILFSGHFLMGVCIFIFSCSLKGERNWLSCRHNKGTIRRFTGGSDVSSAHTSCCCLPWSLVRSQEFHKPC